MNGFSDLHCHLLIGVDDGAKDRSTALAMLDDAAANGIRKIVATPHFNSGFTTAFLTEKTGELQQEARRRGIELTFGTEYNFKDLPITMPPIRLGGAPVVLLDFRTHTLPPDLLLLLDDLITMNLTVVIAHPERTFSPTQKNAIAELHEAGIEFQLTASSITGDIGPNVQYWAFQLLENGSARLIASDAHNADSRPSRMAAASKVIAKRYGAHAAEILFNNTDALLEARNLQDPHCKPLPWYRRLFSR